MQNPPAVVMSPGDPILAADEPPPVATVLPNAPSPFLLLGDHAGNLFPRGMGTLGLAEAETRRHIAWDIGIYALGTMLAQRLNATFIHQRYSRLVIDCNRRPNAPDSIPRVSDGTAIEANAALDPVEAETREASIHAPYHAAIAGEIERRRAAGQETILISLHSFTPSMKEIDRPWQVGVLHDAGDNRFARAMLAAFAQDATLTVGDNEPYAMDDIDYTVPVHAYPHRLPYAEIEIRQDLLGDDVGLTEWCDRVESAMIAALSSFQSLETNSERP